MDEAFSAQLEDDPIVEAFLGFLAEDVQCHSNRIAPLSQAAMERVQKLTQDVVVENSEILPEDITF